MAQLLRLLCGALIGLFQSSVRREAEILVLRQQINVLRRKSPKRPALNNADRLLFVWLSRLVPTTRAALVQTVGRTLASRFWADCTTNISGRKFPTGTGLAGG
jgi:hypothetical protein